MKNITEYKRNWARKKKETDPTFAERHRLAMRRYRAKKKPKNAIHKRGRPKRINDDYEENRIGFCRKCGMRAIRKNGRYCQEHKQ